MTNEEKREKTVGGPKWIAFYFSLSFSLGWLVAHTVARKTVTPGALLDVACLFRANSSDFSKQFANR